MNIDKKLQNAFSVHSTGRLDEAEALYREILKKKPREHRTLHHIGLVFFQRRQLDAAVEWAGKAIAANRSYPEGYNFLGTVLREQEKFDDAVAAHRQAIRLAPRYAEAYNGLGSDFLSQSKLDEAIEAFNKALELDPNLAVAHYNMGVALQQQRKLDAAIAAFRQAIVKFPNFAEAYCNIGLALTEQGRMEEAVVELRRAIEIKPDFPFALNNLAVPLRALHRPGEVIDALRRAVELKPDFVQACMNLGTILREQGRVGEAVDAYRKALAVEPGNALAEIELIQLSRRVCDWSNFDDKTRRLRELVEAVEPFILLTASSTSAEQLACAQRYAAKMPHSQTFTHDNSRQRDKIRIGYLSADFRRHATAYLMAELFERHDRSRFEIFAYSYGYDDKSDVRQRLVNSFDHFVDFISTDHTVAARRIYDDGIDILVDLKGYTGGARTAILVDRPAPIQANYIGFPATMGADFIDYIIADPFLTPLEHQPFYSEKIVQLPDSYQPNDTKRQITADIPPRAVYGLPESGFVFCSFNGSYKITPTFFDIWMRLLKAVPGSVLWLLATDAAVEENLRREMVARGVEPQRLIFAPGLVIENHLARHQYADLFLDTLPVNAHTTASDALWAGLPVLTCAGQTFAGRVAGSLLRAIGLPELITTSLADYESLALELAGNPQKLAALRDKLARNRLTTPLFDIARLTRNLETAYTQMWEKWRRGEPPSAIVVEAQ